MKSNNDNQPVTWSAHDCSLAVSCFARNTVWTSMLASEKLPIDCVLVRRHTTSSENHYVPDYMSPLRYWALGARILGKYFARFSDVFRKKIKVLCVPVASKRIPQSNLTRNCPQNNHFNCHAISGRRGYAGLSKWNENWAPDTSRAISGSGSTQIPCFQVSLPRCRELISGWFHWLCTGPNLKWTDVIRSSVST